MSLFLKITISVVQREYLIENISTTMM